VVTVMGSPNVPEAEDLLARARAVLDDHWRPDPGCTVPSAATYPHQWLWDSCFHAVIWCRLGEADRAVTELVNVFAHQDDDGFVPHLTYWGTPGVHAELWGRRWTSCVTQPPMFGHALAELHRAGVEIPEALVVAAADGLRFLLETRRRGEGRLVIVHPWESGCDDSPRWDRWYPCGRWDRAAGFGCKGAWVRALRRSPVGSPVGSDELEVVSAAFAALVAFNVAELAAVAPVDDDLLAATAAVEAHLAASWDGEARTFADTVMRGPRTDQPVTVRTLEALLPVLVLPPDHPAVDDVFAQLQDETAFGGACGPAQVHRGEAVFDPGTYWRGPAWPPLSYLFWVAARRRGREVDARALRDAAVRGAVRSRFAEYWHPDTGAGHGAVPQSWTGLAAVMAAEPPLRRDPGREKAE
jgi:hypothetical protein